jgi:hypothetical protein
MTIRSLPLAVAFAGLGIMVGVVAMVDVRAPAMGLAAGHVGFAETRWPFGLDEWGIGKAFVCAPAQCGVEIKVYVRSKIGFCNCSTGVSDDAELERVADAYLVSPESRAAGPGHPIAVGWMKGRLRPYWLAEKSEARLMSIAFNNECDVLVAVATLGDGEPAKVEPAVVAFLNSEPVLDWARHELGL